MNQPPRIQTQWIGKGVVGYDCPDCGVTDFHSARFGLRYSNCKLGKTYFDKRIVLLEPVEGSR